eukprot:gnl/Spiro4/28284_TR13990_c0_g1_i1.p1 gnl/Spiro4/28284_TR13990_c0_g1~~gnl/Spiro4/28284_TR13990_c0_g1_i1.p1  ORF type:complete len:237 (+),score=30.84 gnl/Spiro4/28284_TR13990_c0_g1_i1:146-856(+)
MPDLLSTPDNDVANALRAVLQELAAGRSTFASTVTTSLEYLAGAQDSAAGFFLQLVGKLDASRLFTFKLNQVLRCGTCSSSVLEEQELPLMIVPVRKTRQKQQLDQLLDRALAPCPGPDDYIWSCGHAGGSSSRTLGEVPLRYFVVETNLARYHEGVPRKLHVDLDVPPVLCICCVRFKHIATVFHLGEEVVSGHYVLVFCRDDGWIFYNDGQARYVEREFQPDHGDIHLVFYERM